MALESAAPSIVKSVVQRHMLNTWLRLFSNAQQLPVIEQFQFDRIEDERPDLVYFEVEYEAGEPRFIVAYEGRRLAEAFGTSGEGKYIEEVLGPKLATSMLPLYFQCWHAADRSIPFLPFRMHARVRLLTNACFFRLAPGRRSML